MSIDLAQLLNLDPIEKLKIIVALEESMASADPIALTPEQQDEIRRRKAEMLADPESALDWDEVERQLGNRDA